MAAEIEKREIIKQFIYWIDGLDHPIHSRLSEFDDGRFSWEISHYYRQAEGAGIRYPDPRVGHSLEEMDYFLNQYVNDFTAEFGVEEAPNYYAFKKPPTK